MNRIPKNKQSSGNSPKKINGALWIDTSWEHRKDSPFYNPFYYASNLNDGKSNSFQPKRDRFVNKSKNRFSPQTDYTELQRSSEVAHAEMGPLPEASPYGGGRINRAKYTNRIKSAPSIPLSEQNFFAHQVQAETSSGVMQPKEVSIPLSQQQFFAHQLPCKPSNLSQLSQHKAGNNTLPPPYDGGKIHSPMYRFK
jgi:hypothetical protein